MSLIAININNFRNFSQAELDLSEQCNIFYGKNGSGKTSSLEAIYHLILGRSFRSHILRRIIKHDSKSFSIFGKIAGEKGITSVGLSKSIEASKQIKINGQKVSSNIEITRLLPLQLLNHNSYSLLYDSSKTRRQFIDRGLFHVEQSFLDLWRKVNRILEQRNFAIRNRSKIDDIKIWDDHLAKFGYELHQRRKEHIDDFIPIAQDTLQKLLSNFSIDISYSAGWDTNIDLKTFLTNNISRDMQLGYTSAGPQRADIRILSKKIPAKDSLSRGQQKLLVYALQIAQGVMIAKLANKKSIYLVDDLLAELDDKKSQLISTTLLQIPKSQLFITGLIRKDLEKIFIGNTNSGKIFCVTDGRIEN